jgi:IS4 transposase
MTAAEIIAQFEEKRPIAVLAQMTLDRVLSDKGTEDVFHECANHQYQRTLLFSSLTRLMASVVLCRQRSVRAAYLHAAEELSVSLNAVYGKLDRLEPALSQALVRYSYRQVREVCDELGTVRQSPVLGYRPKILDGNHLSATDHRLKETRCSTAAPLPGKLLVVLDPLRQAIADLFPMEDGHAQERSGLDAVIETIEAGDLWIADRNFCTLKFLYAIDSRQAKFVIRLHGQVKGQEIGEPRLVGETDTGAVYENRLELPGYEGKTLVVRRIEVRLLHPDRDGNTTIVILTNLDADEVDALKVAEIYRSRWTIETAFQKLTTSLQCELHTLCYPRAALFAFSLACVAYNAVAMVLAAIGAEHGMETTEELSFHTMSWEISHALDGMLIVVPPQYWRQIKRLPADEFSSRLRAVARKIDLAKYRKARRGPKKPKAKIRHRSREVHVSTAQILAQRKQ